MTRRTTINRMLRLGSELGPREREIIEVVEKVRLATHAQLASLLPVSDGSSGDSAARSARRMLARLTELGVLARLERRVGGVRAGSAGYVYYLGPVGQRLIAHWNGRGFIRGRVRPEPGGRYVRHRLAVSEIYFRTREAAAAGDLDLMTFEIEPDSWRTYLDGFGGTVTLKPDAFVRLGVGAYEDRFFLEVDLGTESRTVLAKKVRAYLAYFQSGAEQAKFDVFPRVLLLSNSDERRGALVDICERLPAEHWSLFAIGALDEAIEVMGGHVDSATGGTE